MPAPAGMPSPGCPADTLGAAGQPSYGHADREE